MEENVTQMNDPVFDLVNEKVKADQEISERCVTEFIGIIKKFLEEDEEFTTKHGFLALGRTIVYLTQTFCKDNEHFEYEIEKANALAVDKMMLSLMPAMKDGKIIDENFDQEDVSLRRVLMAIGALVDYTFWRNELSNYAQKRAELEGQSSDSEIA